MSCRPRAIAADPASCRSAAAASSSTIRASSSLHRKQGPDPDAWSWSMGSCPSVDESIRSLVASVGWFIEDDSLTIMFRALTTYVKHAIAIRSVDEKNTCGGYVLSDWGSKIPQVRQSLLDSGVFFRGVR